MNASLPFDRLARCLVPISLVYLSLPYPIFFLGWLKWYFALPCIALLLLPLLSAFRQEGIPPSGEPAQAGQTGLPLSQVFLVLLVSLLLLSVSGVGGFGYQDTDWFKHNAILKALVERSWPVYFPNLPFDRSAPAVPLVYYIAYYLPAALAGKLGGWLLANQVLLAWSWVGLVLALLWFLCLNRRGSPGLVLFFIFFSGLDLLGRALVTPALVALRPESGAILRWDHIEQWAWIWQYSSNLTLLFWVPHQALAGWIAASLLLHAAPSGKHAFFTLALTPLWSPFITIGLLPFFLARFLLDRTPLPGRLRQVLSLSNGCSPTALCSLALLAVTGLFYSARLYPLSPQLKVDLPHGWIFSFAQDAQVLYIGIALWLVFCLLEFGLYALLLSGRRQGWDKKTKLYFLVALACLALLPFYRYGILNDLTMRASIPALFVLAVLIGGALYDRSLPRLQRLFLILLILLAAATPLIELQRHVDGIYHAGALLQIPPVDQVTNLWDYKTKESEEMIVQYIGSPRAPFFTILARDR